MYTVEFYKDANDHCEIGEYFAELAEKAKTNMRDWLEREGK